jgi:hypothetical protein
MQLPLSSITKETSIARNDNNAERLGCSTLSVERTDTAYRAVPLLTFYSINR